MLRHLSLAFLALYFAVLGACSASPSTLARGDKGAPALSALSDDDIAARLSKARQKMEAKARALEMNFSLGIAHFLKYYRQFLESKGAAEHVPSTQTGLLNAQNAGEHADKLLDATAWSADERQYYDSLGRQHLSQLGNWKLNGGIGTGMGLKTIKAALAVKPSRSGGKATTFLHAIAKRSMALGVPLLFLNTPDASPATWSQLPRADFSAIYAQTLRECVQFIAPRISERDWYPLDYVLDGASGQDPERLQWMPPGHGSIFTALHQKPLGAGKSVLEHILTVGAQPGDTRGRRYALISNSDNLGGTPDLALFGAFVASGAPMMMEVTQRTRSDNKGGHLYVKLDEDGKETSRLALREGAQVSDRDRVDFEDVSRYGYFNTNNIWYDLRQLQDALHNTTPEGTFDLPLIVNAAKAIGPGIDEGYKVTQLETAMGALIGLWPSAKAVVVPRTRFAPVKTTNQLLIVRSDVYALNEGTGELTNQRSVGAKELVVKLGPPAFYKNVDDFEARTGAADFSLIEAGTFEVEGDIRFAGEITIQGDVKLVNTTNKQVVLRDKTWRTGTYVYGSQGWRRAG